MKAEGSKDQAVGFPKRQTPICVKEFLEKNEEPTVSDMYWSKTIGSTVDQYTGDEILLESLDPFIDRKPWEESLVNVIHEASQRLHKTNLRGPAQYVIVHNEALKLLAQTKCYRPEKQPEQVPQFESSVFKVGMLDNRYFVLVSNELPSYRLLVCSLGEGLEYRWDNSNPATSVPHINITLARDPKYFKNELAYWTFINILGVEAE